MSSESIIANESARDTETQVSFTNMVGELEFTRKNIESLGSNIRLVDSDEEKGLDLFCYISCKIDDPEIVKQCRGVVFDKEGNIVLKSFPYTIEYTEENKEEISKDINLSECLVYDAYEGAIIKMFYYQNKWFVSTNRKLDAYRSKWASKESFGFFFQEALEYEFQNNERIKEVVSFNPETDNVIELFGEKILDKTKQYMFLVLNNSENRIVCDKADHPTLYHVGTYINGELSMDEDIMVPYPRKHNFEDIQQLYNYVYDVNYTKIQGVIVFAPNNVQYKILNVDYKDLYTARGNEPSINFRYLQTRMDKRTNDMLRYLYPSRIPNFEDYENILYRVSKTIYDAYIQRFIKKQFVTLPREEYTVMSQAHDWHQIDREANRITLNKVVELLNNQPATNLNRIIRRIKLEEKKIVDGVERTKTPYVKKQLLPRNNSSSSELKEHASA